MDNIDVQLLIAAIVKADEELISAEGIGLVRLLGDSPEAETVRKVLEARDKNTE